MKKLLSNNTNQNNKTISTDEFLLSIFWKGLASNVQ